MKITRRKVIAGMGVLSITALASARCAFMPKKISSRRPNLILFIADDLRYDALGFTGNNTVKTPYLDKLAEDSFVFTNSFVTTSFSPSSRASIYTGEYALRHKVLASGQALGKASFDKSFFMQLKEIGYHLGFIGKWGLGGQHPLKNFNKWYGFSGEGEYYANKGAPHLTDSQTNLATKFIKEVPKNKPFALIVAYKAPHDPLVPQPRFSELYKDIEIPRFKTDSKEAVDSLPELVKKHAKYEEPTPEYNQEFSENMRKYYRLVSGMDESVGKIMAALSDRQLDEKTSLIFTSGNGLLQGDYGLWGKSFMFEDSIRVPLLIRPAAATFPNLRPTKLDVMALNVDIAPTILNMSLLPSPSRSQGKSLLNVMENTDQKTRDGFYYQFGGNANINPCIGYRNEQWKYTHYINRKSPLDYSDCLYNLHDDPDELINLANNPEYEEKMGEMRHAMQEEKKHLQKL
jgi:arylsulfatase A-like enzyme